MLQKELSKGVEIRDGLVNMYGIALAYSLGNTTTTAHDEADVNRWVFRVAALLTDFPICRAMFDRDRTMSIQAAAVYTREHPSKFRMDYKLAALEKIITSLRDRGRCD